MVIYGLRVVEHDAELVMQIYMFTMAEALMLSIIATQQLRAHVNNFILLYTYISTYITWWYLLSDEDLTPNATHK